MFLEKIVITALSPVSTYIISIVGGNESDFK